MRVAVLHVVWGARPTCPAPPIFALSRLIVKVALVFLHTFKIFYVCTKGPYQTSISAKSQRSKRSKRALLYRLSTHLEI